MNPWLALYPSAWRARYGDEFAALLAARPPVFGDRLDIVRGAIDAHLDPQQPGLPQLPATPADRAIGVVAIGAGLLMTFWTVALVAFARPWGAGTTDLGPYERFAWTAAWLGAALGSLALLAIVLRHGARIGDLAALGGVAAGLGLLITSTGLLAATLIAYGTFLLARGMGRRLVPAPIATLLVGASVLAMAGMVAFVLGSGQDLRLLWCLMLYGPSWMVFGVAMLLRRSDPVATRGPVVPAAI